MSIESWELRYRGEIHQLTSAEGEQLEGMLSSAEPRQVVRFAPASAGGRVLDIVSDDPTLSLYPDTVNPETGEYWAVGEGATQGYESYPSVD